MTPVAPLFALHMVHAWAVLLVFAAVMARIANGLPEAVARGRRTAAHEKEREARVDARLAENDRRRAEDELNRFVRGSA